MNREIIDKTTDPFMQNIYAVINKQYSDQLSRKIKLSHQNKEKNTKTAINMPIGYIWDKDIREWAIDPKTKEIVGCIFNLYDNYEYSTGEVADIVNAKNYRTVKGKKFSKSSIHHMLSNKVYCGYLKYKGEYINAKHDSYISEEHFAHRMKKMSLMTKKKKGAVSNQQLLSKFANCSKCGRQISGYQKDGYTYYNHKCTELDEKNISMSEVKIFKGLAHYISKIFYSEKHADFLKKLFKTVIKTKSNTVSRERKSTEKNLKELETKKDRLLDLYLDSKMKKEDLDKKSIEIDNQIESLNQRLQDLSIDLSSHQHKVTDLIEYLRKFSQTFLSASDEDRIKLLKTMAYCIKTDGENVKVEWHKPFSYLLDTQIVEAMNTEIQGLKPLDSEAIHGQFLMQNLDKKIGLQVKPIARLCSPG